MSHHEPVLYRTADRIAEIRINRPPVNSLDEGFIDGIIAGLQAAAADGTVRCVIIASDVPGRFCAGLDLVKLINHIGGEDSRRLAEKLYVRLSEAQAALGKPSIAVVNGTTRGGGMSLAISCDVIIAGESATFGYPEIDLAVLPAIHFMQLPRIVGRHRAFDLLFSGRSFSAQEALSLGIISRVVKDAELEQAARDLALTFAAKSPTAVRMGREAFARINVDPYRQGLRDAVDDFHRAAQTPDIVEGLRAFIEKRRPNW